MARILIIEDDPQLLTVMEIVLEKNGHDVFTAINGKKGLDCLKQNPVDLVVTDIIMPEMDGIEVMQAVQGMKNRPGIIAISGGSQRIDQGDLLEIAQKMKVDKVMPKPITPADLREAVEALLVSRCGL